MGQVKTIKRGELARHGYVPPEGTTGQVLKKTSDDDNDTEFGDPLASGGTSGQTFRKNSGSDFDGKWEDQFPIVSEETSASVTPIIFTHREKRARRYLTANDPAAATTNATALKALFNPDEDGFRGRFILDGNNDIYHVDDKIAFRQGIDIRGEGNTIQFTRTGDSTDTDHGALHAIQDFTLENCKIVVRYTHTGGTNTFNGLGFGGRANGNVSFQNFFEDTAPYTDIGNIIISGVEIDHDGDENSQAVLMYGGLRNCLFENIKINGNSTLKAGLFYEFGWATSNAVTANRRTAHANNLVFKNIEIKDLSNSVSSNSGVRLGGAYNSELDNINVRGSLNGITVSPGESLNFRPADPKDLAGVKRNISMKNIIMSEIEGTAVSVTGQVDNTGLLSPITIDDIDKVDLYDFTIDGFSFLGGTNSTTLAVGIKSSAGKTIIKNGFIKEAGNAIQLGDEAVQFNIDNVNALDGTGTVAFRLGLQEGIFSPERKKTGFIRNCKIAGTAGQAINIDHCENVIIEGNRFGYETSQDGQSETTQTNAIVINADSHVIAKNNYVAGISAGSAYASIGAGTGILINPRGIKTASAVWNFDTNADTSGASLVDLETEVNELKQTLRDVGILDT